MILFCLTRILDGHSLFCYGIESVRIARGICYVWLEGISSLSLGGFCLRKLPDSLCKSAGSVTIMGLWCFVGKR